MRLSILSIFLMFLRSQCKDQKNTFLLSIFLDLETECNSQSRKVRKFGYSQLCFSCFFIQGPVGPAGPPGPPGPSGLSVSTQDYTDNTYNCWHHFEMKHHWSCLCVSTLFVSLTGSHWSQRLQRKPGKCDARCFIKLIVPLLHHHSKLIILLCVFIFRVQLVQEETMGLQDLQDHQWVLALVNAPP